MVTGSVHHVSSDRTWAHIKLDNIVKWWEHPCSLIPNQSIKCFLQHYTSHKKELSICIITMLPDLTVQCTCSSIYCKYVHCDLFIMNLLAFTSQHRPYIAIFYVTSVLHMGYRKTYKSNLLWWRQDDGRWKTLMMVEILPSWIRVTNEYLKIC